VKDLRRRSIAVLALALWLVSGSVAEAQRPIRIGASASKTGTFAAVGQNQLRGYDAILKLDFNAVFDAFKVDADGRQIAHKMVTIQWQDGKRVIVWPEELAPGKPRFPTPPWSRRQ
jgi:hypothetical protein